MQKDIKSQALSGFFWKYAERCGAQGIQFIVQIVLARLLTPSDYGLIGLIAVFITIAQVFAQSGLGQALVQRKDADNIDYSTVFYYSIIFSIILYIVLFLFAPLIASFYDTPQLTAVVRVLGFVIVIGAVNSVQNAYVQKTMQFKKFFWATLGGTIVSAFVGIYMAYNGLGIWALVGQQLTNQIIDTIVLWITVKWRPILVFSFKRVKMLFSYGWKLLMTSLINVIYNNIYSLIIGKFYSSENLGYYNRGMQFPSVIETNIDSTVESVLFPVMSKFQDDRERLKLMVKRFIKTSTFLVFPIMAGLAAVAKSITIVLLTEKWLPVVPFIQFSCFSYALAPLFKANLQAINAIGRSDIFLKLEIIKRILSMIILILTLTHGLYAMMIGKCLSSIVNFFLDSWQNKKFLNYSCFDQLKDIFPAFLLSLTMCVVVLLIGMLNFNTLILLILQIIIGIILYFGLAKIFKVESLNYLLDTIRGFMNK